MLRKIFFLICAAILFVGCHLDSISDLIENLSQNKIDAFVIGKIYAENLNREGIAVDYLPQAPGDVPLSYIFPKNERGQKLCEQMNEFLAKVEANGELDALKNKWLFDTASDKPFEKTALSGENGTLKIGSDGDAMPFIFMREGQAVGYAVELFDKFCAAYGYDYEFKIEIFPTMLMDLSTGKFDVAMNGI